MRFKITDEVVADIRAAYESTPGLSLNFFQAQHAWNLSSDLCERALDRLLRSGFLNRTPDGTYERRGTTGSRIHDIRAILRAM